MQHKRKDKSGLRARIMEKMFAISLTNTDTPSTHTHQQHQVHNIQQMIKRNGY